MLTTSGVNIGNVTFEPGCRNNWNGEASDSRFSHLAIEVPAEGSSNEWLEAVADEVYNKLK